jgi:hypothetical protein
MPRAVRGRRGAHRSSLGSHRRADDLESGAADLGRDRKSSRVPFRLTACRLMLIRKSALRSEVSEADPAHSLTHLSRLARVTLPRPAPSCLDRSLRHRRDPPVESRTPLGTAC